MTPRLLFVLVLANAAYAEAPQPSPPSAVQIQYGVCVQCHGAHGEGRPELGAPRIGDLDATYLQGQLEAFRHGLRGTHPDDEAAHPMSAVAQGLPAAVLPTLAAFVSSLQPAPQRPGPKEARGAALYRPCATCHGTDATGDATRLAPALAQQDAAYLTRQLTNYRDGRRGQGTAAVMAQQVQGLSEADIDALVDHIISLRPPLPPLDNPPVTRTEAEGLQAFADIYAVATHPRCMNCHPDGDAPLQGDDSAVHTFGVTRFSPLDGVHCSTCHAPVAVGDGQAPLPPADPLWSMPPRAMAFQDRTPAELCAQLKDPDANGGRGFTSLAHHVQVDHLLITSWHSGRQPPPIPHEDLVQRFVTWGQAGGPCPD